MDPDLSQQLDDTLGCVFIGLTLALILYGFSLAQTQYYFHEYSSCDHLSTQALVAFLWLLDTARTCCGLQFLWVYLIDNHTNLSGLSQFTDAFIADAFFATLIILITQLYYINVIWRLIARQQHRLFLASIMVAATESGSRVTSSIQSLAAFVVDAYIAATLSVVLHGKRTGLTRTDSLLTKLIISAVHRGILTALLQFLQFITYIVTLHSGGTKLIWAVFYFPASKVNTNSLLAMLNVRHWLRESMVQDVELNIGRTDSGSSLSPRGSHPRTTRILLAKGASLGSQVGVIGPESQGLDDGKAHSIVDAVCRPLVQTTA
ncbi:uncharacterized protein C8Q71DRAFT_405384 [Rhodofomes roseus]|uniref:DUF6534 domain-containing protein n=1 Tax=Rhodofomes roseus TaxID=34475 RepID=A0ABQ8JYW4_9APHY|nr:uncharacterized protein C8Q71DRAFT_405384 [Rhodofomes roseus]KAH9829457.1 hypothetical protein C8Q71DRAFT_405384 [Rhodofomes roseus]